MGSEMCIRDSVYVCVLARVVCRKIKVIVNIHMKFSSPTVIFSEFYIDTFTRHLSLLSFGSYTGNCFIKVYNEFFLDIEYFSKF